jgi:predicted aspartyl protease
MPIDKYPFTVLAPGDIPRPFLPIRIINPSSGQLITSLGLIDTGADDCAIPASFATMLGHNLAAGQTKQIGTGNGLTNAYAHTTRIEIFSMDGTLRIVHTINDTPIDFMPNLAIILLGVNSFLSRFKLFIDYPNHCFSIKNH